MAHPVHTAFCLNLEHDMSLRIFEGLNYKSALMLNKTLENYFTFKFHFFIFSRPFFFFNFFYFCKFRSRFLTARKRNIVRGALSRFCNCTKRQNKKASEKNDRVKQWRLPEPRDVCSKFVSFDCTQAVDGGSILLFFMGYVNINIHIG